MYSRVDNHQKFSTFRLIPSINQKNYFTNYLKKDSQYLCRRPRERSDPDTARTVVFHLGSRNVRCGFSDDAEPQTLPFCVAKRQRRYDVDTAYYGADEAQQARDREQGDAECAKALAKRLHDAKIKLTQSSGLCASFNGSQRGEPTQRDVADDPEAHQLGGDARRLFCVEAPVSGYTHFWPLRRGVLNEDPAFYASAEELKSDVEALLRYLVTVALGAPEIERADNLDFDAVLVVPDMFERKSLDLFAAALFAVGFQNLAVLEEAVAATYGAGISAACVVDIGAHTTTVACVDDGMCVTNSRVKLDFGGDDVTDVLGRALAQIKFPGRPAFLDLDALKTRILTVQDYEIAVQLESYFKARRKYDFKVYTEVATPVYALFYPLAFGLPARTAWRHRLFAAGADPYTGEPDDGISDADIALRLDRLAIRGETYKDLPQARVAASGAAAEDLADEDGDGEDEDGAQEKWQLNAYKSLDPCQCVHRALDVAITESIGQARLQSPSSKQYYENLLLVGAGAKVPGLATLLCDRLSALTRFQRQQTGEISVFAMSKDTDVATLCWRGGAVYSKLKIIDEMWTTRHEWGVLGSRSLYYKAALYSY